MSLRRLVPCFLVLAAASLPTPFSSQARRSAVWFEGARVIIGDKSPVIENAAFLVEGDSFTWVGKKGERQPPANATRLDLTGKTVMPTLIDGHNHIGLVNEKDGTNKKANYTRENLIDQLQRYAYYGTAATLSMGLEADQELAYKLRDDVKAHEILFRRRAIRLPRHGGRGVRHNSAAHDEYARYPVLLAIYQS